MKPRIKTPQVSLRKLVPSALTVAAICLGLSAVKYALDHRPTEAMALLAGAAAFLGHLFPVFLNFKGGKGVATFLGTLLALAWPVGVACCATWLVVAVLSRISSLSALVAAGSSTFWMLGLGHGRLMILGVILTLLVYWRHAANIARLKAGTEPKIGKK